MPTSKIRTILTHPEDGLIPFLERSLQADWSRWQIKPWNFKDSLFIDGGAGYRLTDVSSENNLSEIIVSQTITLGKTIIVEDHADAMILAAELQMTLDLLIHDWNKCHGEWVDPITTIDGAIFGPQQDTALSSGVPNSWAIAVIRSFELKYHEDGDSGMMAVCEEDFDDYSDVC